MSIRLGHGCDFDASDVIIVGTSHRECLETMLTQICKPAHYRLHFAFHGTRHVSLFLAPCTPIFLSPGFSLIYFGAQEREEGDVGKEGE